MFSCECYLPRVSTDVAIFVVIVDGDVGLDVVCPEVGSKIVFIILFGMKLNGYSLQKM